MKKNHLKIGLLFFLTIQATLSLAQINFASNNHDFGILSNWSQTPAIFEYENTGNQPEAFLNAVRSENVHLKYSTSFIKAGEKGQVLIYFEPLQIGHFNEKIKLFVGSSDKPFVFTISGTVNSNLECPSVNMPSNPALLVHEHKGIVINRQTKEAIPNAEIKLIDHYGEKFHEKTNKEGRFKKKLKWGMYQVIITAENFYPLDEMIYLNMNTAELVFELSPVGDLVPDKPEDKITQQEIITKEKDEVIEEDETVIMPFELHGIVLNNITNEPLNKASVKLVKLDTKTPYTYKTFPDGKFHKQLLAGTYSVFVQASDYYSYEDTVSIHVDNDYLEIKLNPEKATEIEPKEKPARLIVGGTVRNKENKEPVKRAMVELTDRKQVKYTYLTMADGKYQKTLNEGSYYVSITAEGFLPYFDSIQIEYPTHELDFFMDFIFVEDEKISLDEEEVPDIGIIQEKKKIAEGDKVELLPTTRYAANNIVFLVDVSSSMKKKNKLDHLKTSMKRLTEILRDIDQVSLISYASSPVTIFIEIPADEKDTIIKSIDSLSASGLTHGVRGLEKAYLIAEINYIEGGNNQVIVATDGKFNSPDHSEIELVALITKYRQKGIITSVIGFGNDEKAIRRMKRMASIGNGNFIHILDEEQARTVLIEEIKGNSRRGN
ncbi:MAG: carboxypeptidase regulatory-like domain-containing protein [Bacteroidetes bacterium]|nr:carboxypeptidase regulatory-like domain-containing protein [Bacteroidota bacterium]